MGQQLVLQFLTAPLEGKLLVLAGPKHSVGRARGHTVCIPVGSVSTQHARIALEGDSWQVEDTQSTNGTFVNGARLGSVPARLDPGGGILSFAQVECRYWMQASASAVPPTVVKHQAEIKQLLLAELEAPSAIPANPETPKLEERAAPDVSRQTLRLQATPLSVPAGIPGNVPSTWSQHIRLPATLSPLGNPNVAGSPSKAGGPSLAVLPARADLGALAEQGVRLEQLRGVVEETAPSLISLSELYSEDLPGHRPESDAAGNGLERVSPEGSSAQYASADTPAGGADSKIRTTFLQVGDSAPSLRDTLQRLAQAEREKATLTDELARLQQQLRTAPQPRARIHEDPLEVRLSGLVAQSLPFLERVVLALQEVEVQLGRVEANSMVRSRVLEARLALGDLRTLLEDARG